MYSRYSKYIVGAGVVLLLATPVGCNLDKGNSDSDMAFGFCMIGLMITALGFVYDYYCLYVDQQKAKLDAKKQQTR